MPVVKVQVPGDVAYREVATRTIAFVCKKASEDRRSHSRSTGSPHPSFSDQLVSAVSEAFNNVALHGYNGSRGGTVVVAITFDYNHVTVELIDEGKTFNPQAVATPDFESLPESGMGLYIIRAFVDEMDYSPGPPNVLTLTKRFSSSGQQS